MEKHGDTENSDVTRCRRTAVVFSQVWGWRGAQLDERKLHKRDLNLKNCKIHADGSALNDHVLSHPLY